MRQIKFRGIRKDNGKWVYGDLIHEPWGTMIQSIETKMPTGVGAPEAEPTKLRHKYTVDPDTVGEWTGLVDKTGAEIYEGDIIQEARSIGKVIYNQDGFEIDWTLNKDFWSCTLKYHAFEAEVIGNVHQNAELLEAKRDV